MGSKALGCVNAWHKVSKAVEREKYQAVKYQNKATSLQAEKLKHKRKSFVSSWKSDRISKVKHIHKRVP